jgi:hypothetical protein
LAATATTRPGKVVRHNDDDPREHDNNDFPAKFINLMAETANTFSTQKRYICHRKAAKKLSEKSSKNQIMADSDGR